MSDRAVEIPVNKNLRDKLKSLKGNRTWNEFLDKIIEVAEPVLQTQSATNDHPSLYQEDQ